MYAKRNIIFVGSIENPTYYFENDQIIACEVTQSVALVGQELSIDMFSPVVADNEDNLLDIAHFRSSDHKEIMTGDGQVYCTDTAENPEGSHLIEITDGTPVWYYHENELVGKYYIQAVKRQARNKYKLECVSAIGRLDKMFHGGGLFQATTFGAVLQHILAEGLHGTGNPVISFAIDDDVASLPVSGWLPYASKRDNLYQLIFANGVNIVKNYDGNPRFTFVYTAPELAEEIETGSIYHDGSIEYTKPYSGVSVMEHTYAAITDANSRVLFDNSEGLQVTNEEIWFDAAPVIVSTLRTEGLLTVVSATPNSAVVSGNGKLSGVPYTHSMRTVSRKNTSVAATEEKTVSVTGCTMVNMINSENLLERLFAFYCPSTHIKKIKNSLIYTDQRCGKAYLFKNPYGEEETAYLATIETTASSVVKASCEWYAGYEPAGQQGLYKHVDPLIPEPDPEDPEQEITEGDWTVPEGVTEFKAVLIGGGGGGTSGWPGANGGVAYTHTEINKTDDISAIWYGAEGGDGGEGGYGGVPGRVKVIVVENAVPGTVYHWSLGSGGDGGAATGFIPDTYDELKEMLDETDPDHPHTSEEIEGMIDTEESLSDWDGSPNLGSSGTATTFSGGGQSWSTDDPDGYVPTGGVYDPITNSFYALAGSRGIKGGKGGARKVEENGDFTWVTDGENVKGEDGKTWRGGSTGKAMTKISGLSEAKLTAYGGNGAGAAVGIGRNAKNKNGELLYPHINGGSNQTASWTVTEDE